MSRDPMEGLSKEERRQRALEMLKAKPRDRQASKQLTARERSLEEKERELEERARRLEEMEQRLEGALDRADEPPAVQEEQRTRTAGRKAATVPETAGVNPADQTEEKTAAASTRARRRIRDRAPAPEDTAEHAVETAPTPSRGQTPRTGAGGAILEVTGMSVHYGQIQALRDIDMQITPGEVVALLGANGAGKSSTLKAIAGVVAPSGGDILFEGESIAGLAAHDVVKRGIALVPEGRELFPTLSVEENLRLGFWPRRQEKGGLKKAYEQVYSMFPRLAERRTQAAGTMSGGEQQMLVFGRALMSQPKLLMADEMSLGLAPLIVRTLFEAIEVIHQAGASVIIVEQFVHLALRHSDRAYVLAKGELALEAESATLANDPALAAAYLGGAEGNVEETAKTTARASKPRTSRKSNGTAKSRPAARTGTGEGSKPRRKT